MRRTDTYLNTLEYLEGKTHTVMLRQKDVAALLNVSVPTVRKHYGKYFTNGQIALPVLATILSKEG